VLVAAGGGSCGDDGSGRQIFGGKGNHQPEMVTHIMTLSWVRLR